MPFLKENTCEEILIKSDFYQQGSSFKTGPGSGPQCGSAMIMKQKQNPAILAIKFIIFAMITITFADCVIWMQAILKIGLCTRTCHVLTYLEG